MFKKTKKHLKENGDWIKGHQIKKNLQTKSPFQSQHSPLMLLDLNGLKMLYIHYKNTYIW